MSFFPQYINSLMSNQLVFIKVWQHFVLNKMPFSMVAVEKTDSDDWHWIPKKCRYRQDMTAHCPIRCAAGVILPDNMYAPDYDNGGGKAASAIEVFVNLVEDVHFLSGLQICTD